MSRTVPFLKCACYLAGLGVLSFLLGRLVPKIWFDYTRFPYRAFAFERDGKVYDALGIARWQSRVPDMSRVFPKLMPPKQSLETLMPECPRVVYCMVSSLFLRGWLYRMLMCR